MINTFSKNSHSAGIRNGCLALVCALLLLVSACGKSKNDGDKENTVELPSVTDTTLDLYCVDVGLFNETCVLDDPDNPYRNTPFTVDDPDEPDPFKKGRDNLLEGAEGNLKATFYVWATAQALSPQGENQFFTAVALHELYTASESEVIRIQTIRAYRSTLDNYFEAATFFQAGFVTPPNSITFPVLVRELTAGNLAVPDTLRPLFDPDNALNNEFFARETMGSWGYTWVGMIDRDGAGPLPVQPGPVFKN